MSITPGRRLGPYEVVAKLGAGGMGEVYRAHDTKLGRHVALKVLPDAFIHNPERLARFEREARTLAALNHPNIAAIYGLEANALVMELVEGEDLAHRIKRGPIPLAEALPMARQIAEALQAAHDAGIIHRDLKPANVKVREDGTVKVLDFGLAKAMDAASGTGDEIRVTSDEASTVLSPAVTTIGMIVGTAAYMSPEQAKGRVADRRSDVWAFGVVLYEMLTGRSLFKGSDVTDTLAAVHSVEPNWQTLPAATPPIVRRLLARCLVKDRRLRLDSLGAARLDLDDAITGGGATAPPAPAVTRIVPAALLIAGLTVGAVASRILWPSSSASDSSGAPIVSNIAAAPEALSAFSFGFALSPDATTLVYAAKTADGRRRLWKRRLDDPRAQAMPGTEDATYPFWSPDGRDVGFFTMGAIRRVPLSGGPAQTIATTPTPWPLGSWNERGDILFSPDMYLSGGIFRVPARGGTPVRVIDGDVYAPQWLPDGRHFLFLTYSESESTSAVLAASIDSPAERVPVMTAPTPGRGFHVWYSSAGFLLFNQAEVLSAQKFDAASLKTSGPIVPLGDRAGNPRGWFTAMASGETVVALNPPVAAMDGGLPGNPVSRLRWFDRKGNLLGQVDAPGRYWMMRLSRDGTRVVANPGAMTLWAFDVRTGVKTRVVVGGGGGLLNDARVIYRTDEALWMTPANGEGVPRQLLRFTNRSFVPNDVSPDNAVLVVTARASVQSRSTDIMLVSLPDGAVKPFLTSDFDEGQASFAPNGQWLAYSAASSGRPEIYVRALTGGPPIQMSADGGEHPLWSRDGNELFYLSPTDEIVAVDVSAFARTRQPGTRQVLFRQVTNDIMREWYSPYGVMPDGQRFLINVLEPPEPLTLFQRVAVQR